MRKFNFNGKLVANQIKDCRARIRFTTYIGNLDSCMPMRPCPNAFSFAFLLAGRCVHFFIRGTKVAVRYWFDLIYCYCCPPLCNVHGNSLFCCINLESTPMPAAINAAMNFELTSDYEWGQWIIYHLLYSLITQIYRIYFSNFNICVELIHSNATTQKRHFVFH